MEIETAIRIVIEKSPGLKAKQLWKKVQDKTGNSRSTIYEHLYSLVLREEIFREKGRHYLKKPEKSESDKRPLTKNEKESLERKAESYARAEWLAQNFPSFEPLDDLAKTIKKKRKDMGLEP
jgi:hypothetical protein